ncbi:LysR substrate-binding domain-containing protein [Microbacterium sp. SSM24]|uniref:LysR substrate-binding domain-containing protein n=1 Tax=Microbacterium sp. SSM24 TaxID=2991714 RepID=UPI002226E018|nr:LysR substrate-binding domain-containing protein [Microbacterium sp. SSM24]MCW3492655.1 LysR substrate-binding domain-containing protein [Microbacterium sp. SSM24]
MQSSGRVAVPLLDTRALRYFIAVAEERHFGRAAERLMMAQPPLSQQIRRLENSLGTKLLNRTTRSVDMTAAGEVLLVRGRRLLEDLQRLETDVRRMGQGLQGTLRIGFTGSATYGLMPRVFRESASAFDGLALEVVGELLTPELTQRLVDHRLDVAVLRPPVDSAGVDWSPILEERLIAAIPSRSAMSRRERLSLTELASHPLVGYPEESSVSQTVAAECLRRGIALKVDQRVSETSTLLSLVAAGVGSAIVPESATALSLGHTSFREIVDAPSVQLAIAWRTGDESPVLQRYIPFLQKVILASQKGIR